MTSIQTLESCSIEKIAAVFNLSFSDYIIPFSLTKEQLETKMISESIVLELSVGAFEEDELIGFILHGYGILNNQKTVYNAGTGVIPAKRGNKITAKLYDYALTVFKKHEMNNVVLEVITTNDAAIKTYRNTGFQLIRELNCFKGLVNGNSTTHDYEIRDLKTYNWQQLQSFWDIQPSWQNSITAVEKLKDYLFASGIYAGEELLGYIIFNPDTKRILQLAVDRAYRNKGIGRQLIFHLSSKYGNEFSVTNIDSASTNTTSFLTDLGMHIFIKQYEMGLRLK